MAPAPPTLPLPLICEAARDGDLVKLQELLKASSAETAVSEDLFSHDEDGRTALTYAAMHGHAQAVRLLLDSGSPWNALDSLGKCAGDYAMEEGHQEAFDVLLDTGRMAFSVAFNNNFFLLMFGEPPEFVRSLLENACIF